MRIKSSSLLVVFCGLAMMLNSQTVFQLSYGGLQDDFAVGAVENPDGSYTIGGGTKSFVYGQDDGIYVHISTTGDLIKAEHFGSNSLEAITGMDPLPNGKFVIAGYNDAAGPGTSGSASFHVFDTAGTNVWTTNYGGSALDIFNEVKATPDGGMIGAGYSLSLPLSGYTVKADSNGAIVWSLYVGALSTSELFVGCAATSDNGGLVMGVTSQGAGSDDILLMRLDSTGADLWTKVYGTVNTDNVADAIEYKDGFLLTGLANFSGSSDAYLTRLDSAGNEMWTKAYSSTSNEAGRELAIDAAGNIVIAGWTQGFGAGGQEGMIIKTDSAGNLIWAKAYGGTGADRLESITMTSDGGYLTTGQTASFGAGGNEMYVVKTDTAGNSGCNQVNATLTVIDTSWISTVPNAIAPATGGTSLLLSQDDTTANVSFDTLCATCAIFPSFSLNDTVQCLGDTMMATDATPGATMLSWQWDGNSIGMTPMVSKVLDSAGTYTLSLWASNGTCADSIDSTIVVGVSPNFTISDDEICSGDSIELVNLEGSATSVVWYENGSSFANSDTATWVGTTQGNYTLSLATNLSFCPAETLVTVNAQPVAGFIFTPTNLSVAFTGNATGVIQSWFWDFGDGNSDNVQNPNHTYAQDSTYNVCLTVVTAEGCTDSVCQQVTVMLVGADQAVDNQLVIYPNPNSGEFKIQLDGIKDIITARIIGVDGKTIATKNGKPGDLTFRLPDLRPGVYLLELENSGIKIQKRFIVLAH